MFQQLEAKHALHTGGSGTQQRPPWHAYQCKAEPAWQRCRLHMSRQLKLCGAQSTPIASRHVAEQHSSKLGEMQSCQARRTDGRVGQPGWCKHAGAINIQSIKVYVSSKRRSGQRCMLGPNAWACRILRASTVAWGCAAHV